MTEPQDQDTVLVEVQPGHRIEDADRTYYSGGRLRVPVGEADDLERRGAATRVR